MTEPVKMRRKKTHKPGRTEAWRLAAALAVVGLFAAPLRSAAPELPRLDCVIEPSETVDLSTGVPGVIERMEVDRADAIDRGQLLAQLESGVELASLALARHRVQRTSDVELRKVRAEFSRRQRERSRELYGDSAVSRQELDKLETDAVVGRLELHQALDDEKQARLEMERAEQILARRKIRAPFDGVVVERFKSVGEYVDETAVLRVAKLDPLHVNAFVPVSDLASIAPGMAADVRPESLSGVTYRAWVDRVDRVADAATGTFGVRLLLPNADQAITAGLRCELSFRPDEPARNPRFVPASAPAMQPSPPAVAPPASEPLAAEGRGEAAARVERAVPAAFEGAPVCLSLGPLDDREQARRLVETLGAEAADVRLLESKARVPIGYSVRSAETYTRAQLGEVVESLRRNRFTDVAPILADGNRVRLALGYFSAQNYASKRVEKLARYGVDTWIATETRPVDKFRLQWTQPASRPVPDVLSGRAVTRCEPGTRL